MSGKTDKSDNTLSRSSFVEALRRQYHFRNPLITLALVALLCSNFILLGIDKVNEHTNPEAYDTTAYLGEANFINTNGGVRNFINLSFAGKYKQANQHPLYIVMLSTFASRDIAFFVHAKLASAIIGLVLLLSLFLLTRRLYGGLCASLAAFGLMLNPVFLKWTTLVACESLLMVFSLLCMYWIVRGFECNKAWAYAGIAGGLAYLTKGTGLFLVPGFALSCVWVYKTKVLRNKYFWSFFALFIVAGSPLLIRNVIVYGNPLYNINLEKVVVGKRSTYMFMDPTEAGGGTRKVYDGEKGSEGKKVPQSDGWIEGQLLQRVVWSLAREGGVVLGSLNVKPMESLLWSWTGRIAFGAVLFAFFVAGLRCEGSRGGRLYIVITLITFVVCLSLFNPLDRYLLPIFPVMWMYIGVGVVRGLYSIGGSVVGNGRRTLISAQHAVVALLCVLLGYLFLTQSLGDPARSVEYSEGRRELLKWMRLNIAGETIYTEGPNLNWQLEKGKWILGPNEPREDMEQFKVFVRRLNVAYVIFDWYSLTVSRYRGHVDRRKLIEGYVELDPARGLVPRREIDGWQLWYKDRRTPVKFLVYKVGRI
ncbi:MAG: ArnT family glycosyltransferase [Candidatus Binatia bacterium]